MGSLNLNQYRNSHYHKLNNQKDWFTTEVQPLLSEIPKMTSVWLHYEIFFNSAAEGDLMNVGAVLDKFFTDVVVKAGILPDDKTKYLKYVTFSFGGVAKRDGHALATINNLTKTKDEKMQIKVNEEDMVRILQERFLYLTEGKVPIVNMEVKGKDYFAEINFVPCTKQEKASTQLMCNNTASGKDAFVNELVSNTDALNKDITVKGVETFSEPIPPIEEDETTEEEVKPKRRGRPKGSKNKPKEDDDNDSESSEDSGDTDSAGTASSGTEAAAKNTTSIFDDDEEDTGLEDTEQDTGGNGGEPNPFPESKASPSSSSSSSEDDEGEVRPMKPSSIFDDED
jgi:hypothetical protein